MTDATVTTEALRALGEIGPWDAAGLFIIWQMRREKKNGSGHSVDIGKVIGVQEEQGDLLEKIEENGTVPFQTYKADNEGWKRQREGFEERHGPRVDNAHKRLDTLKERVGNLVTTHNLIHPDQTVR